MSMYAASVTTGPVDVVVAVEVDGLTDVVVVVVDGLTDVVVLVVDGFTDIVVVVAGLVDGVMTITDLGVVAAAVIGPPMIAVEVDFAVVLAVLVADLTVVLRVVGRFADVLIVLVEGFMVVPNIKLSIM